jgi:hypothetical protein
MTKFDPFQSFYLVSEGKRKKRWIGLNLRVMKNWVNSILKKKIQFKAVSKLNQALEIRA